MILDAFKLSEDGKAYVARFREMTGRAARVTLNLAGRKLAAEFHKFEIKTFFLRPHGRKVLVQEADLLEQRV